MRGVTGGERTKIGPPLSVVGGTMNDMPAALSSPGMVGRIAELDELRSALTTTAGGEAVTVLLGGEAGVGKTRLIGEFSREAASRGVRVVLAQCVELGGDGPPYAPVAAALRDLVGQLGAEHVLELAGPGRSALAALVPQLGLSDPSADYGRGRLFEVVAVLLEQASAEQPLLVVVEDIHWADGSTRDLLRFLVRALSSTRLMLVYSYRSDEVNRTHPLRRFLAELDRVRNVERLEVPRLSQAEVGEQLAGIIGQQVAAETVARVYERSGGIPFFVEELARGEIDDGCRPLPDSLRDLLLVGVEQLSDTAQSTLRLLAVGGNRVDHAVLAEVSDLKAAELDQALLEAVSAHVIRVDGEGYAFRHALLREVLHDDLLPGVHVRLHKRYAEVLEERPGLLDGSSAIAEIAHHWYAAHELERAFRAALVAADDAGRSYAHAEAQKLFERALELWDRVNDPAGAAGADHAEILVRAASAAFDAGELERALALIDAALAEVDLDTDATQWAMIVHYKSKILNDLGRSESIKVAKDGLAALPAESPLEPRARLTQLLASQLMMQASFTEAAEVAVDAAKLATAAGATNPLFRAHNVRGPALIHLGRIDEGMAAFASARAAAGDAPEMLVSYYLNLSDALNLLGRYREAVDAARMGIRCAQELGLARTLGAMLAGNAADPLIALGEWDEAERLVRRALDLDPPVRHIWHLLMLRSWLELWRGDVHAAGRSLVELKERMARRSPGAGYAIPTAVLATEIALAKDNVDAAWAEALTALDEPRATGYDMRMLAVAAKAAARRGSPDEAERIRETAAAAKDWGPAGVWRSVVIAELADREPRAVVDLSDGSASYGPATVAWRQVLDEVAAAGGPAYLRPYGWYRLGEAFAADGDRAAATEALREAATDADRLGAGLVRGWVEDLSRRARMPLLNEVASGGSDGGLSLTQRERDVLRLVAAGRSNRQIGEELFITAKTASVHVSNILAKLGVSGRGEAAAMAHRAGLLEEESRQPA